MKRPGRNDPCPCGSGRKYKRCCLGREAPARADEPVGDRAARLAMRILAWAASWDPDGLDELQADVKDAFGTEGEMPGFAIPLLAYHGWSGEKRWCEAFRERHAADLDADERRLLDAFVETWLGIWEVREVFPGEGLRIVDQLTGEEQSVRERSASKMLHARDVLLGAAIRVGAGWQLSTVYPVPLGPADADEVARELKRKLGIRTKRVPKDRLRTQAAFLLGDLWQEWAERVRSAPPPKLVNLDGDPLESTLDRFAFPPEARDAVLEALFALRGAEDHTHPAEQARGETVVGLMRRVKHQPAQHETMTVARYVVGADGVVVETNSRKRADAACALLSDSPVGPRLERGERTHRSFEEMLAAMPQPEGEEEGDEEEGLSPEDLDAHARGFKARHYAVWVDEPLPALGGRTPREAARDRRRWEYRALDLLLREMERHEQRLPEPSRYDFAPLRESLGLPP